MVRTFVEKLPSQESVKAPNKSKLVYEYETCCQTTPGLIVLKVNGFNEMLGTFPSSIAFNTVVQSQSVAMVFNPLRPNSDLSQTSHCNIKGLSVSEVMRIENMISQVKFLWYFNIFSQLLQ